MSPRTRSGLLALILVAALVGIWWVAVDRGSKAGPARQPRPGAAPTVSTDGGFTADLEGGGLERTPERSEEALQRTAVTEEVALQGPASLERASWRRPSGAVWVEGRVVFPDGTPFDEEVIVEAEGAAFPNALDGRRTYRTRCESDGSFRVAFSKRTRYGRIGLVARYVFLKERYKVDFSEPETLEEIRIEPELGGLVVARVLPPHSAAFEEDPLAGVTVHARVDGSRGGKELAGWWSGREGEWEVGGLYTGQEWTLVADSPLWAEGRAEGVEVRAGETTRVDLSLSRGAHISGALVDERGEIIPEGRVMALDAKDAAAAAFFRQPAGKGKVEVRDGTFDLRGVPPGDTVLFGSAEGYLDGRLELGQLDDGSLRSGLRLVLPTGGVLSGQVRWPWGEPAAGAEVRVVQGLKVGDRFEVGRVRGELTLGADGTFRVSGLDPGVPCDVTATAIHPDDRPDPKSRLSVLKAKTIPRWVAGAHDLLPDGPAVDLELSAGDVLTGRVIDDAGEPVERFAVTAAPADAGVLSSSARRPVRGRFRDAEGKFTLTGVQAGVWEVKVTASGYTSSERRRVTMPAAAPLEYRLRRTASITGTVTTPDGQPAKGAQVWVDRGSGSNGHAKVDREGVFKLGKVDAGTVSLIADSDKYAQSAAYSLSISPGERREGVALVLRPGATLIARIHPDAGKRVGRAVTLKAEGVDPLDFTQAARNVNLTQVTDKEGQAVFEGLDPGGYLLEVAPEKRVRFDGVRESWILARANYIQARVSVSPGEVREVVLGGPGPEDVHLHGRVLAAGKPVTGAWVTATDLEEEDYRPTAAIASSEDGTYAMTLDHGGRWRFSVRFQSGSWTVFVIDVPAAGEFEQDFHLPESRIEGTIQGEGGEPQSQMTVTLVDEDSDGRRQDWFAQRRASTDANGHYVFEHLSAGTYHLRVGGGDGGLGILQESDIEYGRVVRRIEVAEDAGVIPLDLKLPPAGELFGTVRTSQGQPVAGATITVTDEDGIPLSQFTFHRSGADGAYTYRGIAPGTYSVVAQQGGKSEPRTFKMYAEGKVELDLVLTD